MRCIYKVLIFALLFLSLKIETTFAENVKPTQYDIHQITDLPQSEVNVVYEDKRGFIWIGTLDGLFRYDGYDYRAFQIDDTEKSLKSNMILAIDEDSKGNIWVGTYGRGLSRVNPQTGNVSNYDFQDFLPSKIKFNDVVSIEIDRHDNIWIANWYYILKVKFNEQNDEIGGVVCYPAAQEQIQDRDYINDIHEDRSGNIWIGSNFSIRRIIEEREGELFCETFDVKCVDMCDYGDDSIIVAGDDLVELTLSNDNAKYQTKHLRSLAYSATKVVSEDRSNIWVGTRIGVAHFRNSGDDKWDLVIRYTKDVMPFYMPANVVSSMILTNDRQLWVGTRGGGVFAVGSNVKPFDNHPANMNDVGGMPSQIVKSLYEDSYDGLWIGTEENGVYYQSDKAQIVNIPINSEDNRAYALEQTGSPSTHEVMWVGTSFPDNLVAIDMKTLRPIKQNLSWMGFVFALKKSDDNTLWAGTYNDGLWRLKIDNRGYVISSKQFTTRNSTINSDIIRSLYISKCGDLLIGTDMGVSRIAKGDIDSEEPHFLHNLYGSNITTINNYVLQITENSKGDILIGTMGNGLWCYSVASDSLRSITTADGLANASVKSIVEDPQKGDIWLSTNMGISKYSPSDGAIINYDKNDGLNDCEFTEICGIRRSNGDILFGNRYGFVSFYPNDIQASNSSLKLYFTDLYVNHKLVSVGENSSSERVILSKTLEYTEGIDLKYDERNFSIEFVGLNFASPYGNKYYVKLEGMESSWREIRGDELVAQYTNIPDGNYQFRVRATNSDGITSRDELKLDIHINPPLRRSTMAYIIYIILIVLILFCVYWVSSAISERKRQLLIAQMDQKRTEEMVQYKLEFFTNISHEFRSPLTLINILLEKMKGKVDNGNDSEMVEGVSEMKYNVDMLLSLVNQLIDFRKIERGKEHIKPQCVNIVDYLHSYFNHFNMLAEIHDIEYNFITNHQSISVDIDTRLFEKVVTNLLSNALKYTPKGGEVKMSVECDESRGVAIVSIKDNGHGVSKDELPLLFDRFYQSNNRPVNTTHSTGSGIGLSLTKSIVELHNGTIRIESDVDQGFECIIELALSSNSPQELPQIDSNIMVVEPSFDSQSTTMSVPNGSKRDLILIVDDDERLRVQISQQLSDSYDVITAENGQIGLDTCLSKFPSLVIADIKMPVMDGIEMCRRIKGDESISHTPIMVLTANATFKNQIDSFTIGGADGYLDKPFNIDILKSKIATILHNRAIIKDRFHKQSILNPEEIVTSHADLKCISKIVSIIKEHIGDSELSIEMIAAEYGVSRVYLNRKIKALTGVTSMQFLRNVRMKYAAQLLLQKQLNVTEVAWAVGYTDPRAFRIRFKEVFGVSPINYKGEEALEVELPTQSE